ncbi:4704_t:CDS:10 [Entrophospora sp. SA101]|nr:4704_t:CDS:10 [Entrophospora sp. SA101]
MVYDPNSLSNIDKIKTNHVDLKLKVNFEEKLIEGSVTLHLVNLVDDVHKVILDTNHLEIKSVSRDGQELPFRFGEENEKFGLPLHIDLKDNLAVNTKFTIDITYNSTSGCTALQWLEPSQTVGKKYPYLFTQCQAIHARSLLPCQDTPAFKLSYNAEVTVPSPLRALMSAIIEIPSYLIALAVGNLEGRVIGPRSTVWSEPEVVGGAAWEFEETEKFIATGEQLLTPYEWGKYDLLVLPASFPYGGMENPCLTFVTPTLLAGDRSLVDVIAHEISHSWMGNLVTTANWEHFWLNEGWTIFTERKIISYVHSEKHAEFDSIIGWRALSDDIKLFGSDNPLTALAPNLKGIDPDDCFSSVPYEKGYNFLYYIQKVVGGSLIFEPYMKAHVKNFIGKSITTQDWKDFLYSYMETNYGPEMKAKLDSIDWNSWLYAPGMPPVKNDFDQTLAKALVLLERLSEYKPFPHIAIAAMDHFYSFTNVRNSEIKFRWHVLCLNTSYEPIYQHVVKFVTEQGRMKYVRPLYRLLNKAKNGSELAKKTFLENRSFYHPIAASMIAKDILGKDC